MDDLGPVDLQRTSSAHSVSWMESTVHSNINVKYDVNASALSVDATGSFGVLAARKGLYVVDLESPYQAARTLHHQTKWDVTVVKCNPHIPYKGVVASTSNHNTLLWNIDHNISTHIGVLSSQQPLISTLRAHTRPVTDVAWSPSEPTVLATSSADTKTHLWDIRTPKKPAQSLCAFTTSATQVEWNRLDSYSLATAHDGDVRIWDTRACDKPTVTITAHMQKIFGLDWSPTNMHELVTCSEDKTIKFWNVTQPRIGQGMVTTGAPVWRARYTPFGDGLVTISHRQDHILRLWSLGRDTSIEPKPVYDFVGHKDLVKGFAWRQAYGAFQLISWSKNQELRMWRLDSVPLEACGLSKPATSVVPNDLQLQTTSTALVEQQQQQAPQIPLSNSSRFPNSVFRFDLSSLKADFTPLPLPANVTTSTTNLDVWDVEDWHPPTNNSTMMEPLSASSVETNFREPIRRVSGGCFSGPNCLVYFDSRVAIGQSKVLHRATPTLAPLPSADFSWTEDYMLDDMLLDDAKPDTAAKPSSATAASASSPYMDNAHALVVKVNVLDCMFLCGGARHPTPTTANIVAAPPQVHAKNAAAAGDVELSQMWSVLAISASAATEERMNESNVLTPPWSAHPFGSNLVQHVLELCEAAGDISTSAAIVCSLANPSHHDLLIDSPKEWQRYDGYKQAHADLLYRQGAMNVRCETLKHLHSPPEPHVGLTLALYCHNCGRPSSELFCGHCKDFSIKCSVCELVVRGQSIFCMNCGHGGHTNHLVDWFATENACPTGCGCWCKQAPGSMEFHMPPTTPHLARSFSF
ncbi:GATOR complex protein wdr59 [Aphanomyces cochlioides]|nr:GATOR complex protein wdr59 [Aphanomyces cochlioides]